MNPRLSGELPVTEALLLGVVRATPDGRRDFVDAFSFFSIVFAQVLSSRSSSVSGVMWIILSLFRSIRLSFSALISRSTIAFVSSSASGKIVMVESPIRIVSLINALPSFPAAIGLPLTSVPVDDLRSVTWTACKVFFA